MSDAYGRYVLKAKGFWSRLVSKVKHKDNRERLTDDADTDLQKPRRRQGALWKSKSLLSVSGALPSRLGAGQRYRRLRGGDKARSELSLPYIEAESRLPDLVPRVSALHAHAVYSDSDESAESSNSANTVIFKPAGGRRASRTLDSSPLASTSSVGVLREDSKDSEPSVGEAEGSSGSEAEDRSSRTDGAVGRVSGDSLEDDDVQRLSSDAVRDPDDASRPRRHLRALRQAVLALRMVAKQHGARAHSSSSTDSSSSTASSSTGSSGSGPSSDAHTDSAPVSDSEDSEEDVMPLQRSRSVEELLEFSRRRRALKQLFFQRSMSLMETACGTPGGDQRHYEFSEAGRVAALKATLLRRASRETCTVVSER